MRDDEREITDDESEAALEGGHFGLTGMQDRAKRAGGSVEVRSRPGGGTVVSVQLPLEESAVGQTS